MANKKAGVTTNVFRDWFYKCFFVEAENYMKEKCLPVKILLGNAFGHPHN